MFLPLLLMSLQSLACSEVSPGRPSISLKVSTGELITSQVLNGRFIFLAIFSSLQREARVCWSSCWELYLQERRVTQEYKF